MKYSGECDVCHSQWELDLTSPEDPPLMFVVECWTPWCGLVRLRRVDEPTPGVVKS